MSQVNLQFCFVGDVSVPLLAHSPQFNTLASAGFVMMFDVSIGYQMGL
jgi:lipid-binding SYLF domain-containing protein